MPHDSRKCCKHGLMTGMAKSKPTRQKLFKIREPKSFPGCLTNEQIAILVSGYKKLRDKLIILMLNGTGMRKGELLGLCHEDIGDFGENYFRVVKRDNPNGARVKGRERTIPVVPEIIKMYENYLNHEYPNPVSNYVFVNIWKGEIGMPMNPAVLNVMFTRLSKKTGIYVYPHLFRHTYATRLLRAGYSPERVKYLLGHTSIQTTLDFYSHVQETDLQEIIKTEEKY